jgi:hypothetical protein
MDQKWRYEEVRWSGLGNPSEGCTAVDARQRAKLVIADLRDVAEPRRYRF